MPVFHFLPTWKSWLIVNKHLHCSHGKGAYLIKGKKNLSKLRLLRENEKAHFVTFQKYAYYLQYLYISGLLAPTR